MVSSRVTVPTGRLARVSYLPGVVQPSELEPSLVESYAIEPGAELGTEIETETETGAEAIETDSRARASKLSMRALTRRGVSSQEMTRVLLSNEIDAESASVEVERLERVGLLDDAVLAETLVRTLSERKGLGRVALSAELRRRGIEKTVVAAAVSELDSESELVRASKLAAKRAPQLRSLDSETARRRLSAFLMRRGYSGSVVSAAVKAALTTAEQPRFR